MLTEANRATLVQDINSNIEWRYPLTSGATQYDFNPDTTFVYRRGEPVTKKFPAIQVAFPGRGTPFGRSLGNVVKDYSGSLVYGYSELTPVIISVFTHLESSGASSSYHGKLIADAYIRRIEQRIRRYWPRMLTDMEAYIHNPTSFLIEDISEFFLGNEMQGMELTMNLITTNKWDYTQDGWNATGMLFDDAVLSGAESGGAWNTYISVSGEMYDK